MKIYKKNKKILNKKKKIENPCIVLLLIMLVVSSHFDAATMEYLKQSKILNLKANNLRSRYWGIEYYFEFNWFFSKRDEKQYKSLDLNSPKFQEYLQSQYTMFRLRKSCIFKQISEICLNILSYQLETHNYLTQTSQHAAMSVIKTLNNNIVGVNEINASNVNAQFFEVYGNTEISPMNIFNALVEKKILTLEKNIYSYQNLGIFNYFYYFSKDLMPLFKTSEQQEKRYIRNIDVYYMLEFLENIRMDFLSSIKEFEDYSEYFKLKELIDDWNNPEQYFEFKDKKLQEIYENINLKKIVHNDKLFHSLLINSVGLEHYFYSKEKELDNYYYYL